MALSVWLAELTAAQAVRDNEAVVIPIGTAFFAERMLMRDGKR
jgi:hypothetical protein